jgi:hypothetical protein
MVKEHTKYVRNMVGMLGCVVNRYNENNNETSTSFETTVCQPSQQGDKLSEVIKAFDVIKASRVAKQNALQEATGLCVGKSHLEESSDSG